MKIKWLGHSCFLITAKDGTRIVTDPYTNNERMQYGPVREAADVVLVSHEHGDHNCVTTLSGNPQIIRGPGRHQQKGIEVEGIAAYHDTSQGSQRGAMAMFVFTIDGMRLCHMGDLGHPLSPEEISKLGKINILFLPVGGFFTIDAAAARKICQELAPQVVIPMHYKTDKCGLPIAGVDDFLASQKSVRRLESSEVEFEQDKLPQATEAVVLEHAM